MDLTLLCIAAGLVYIVLIVIAIPVASTGASSSRLKKALVLYVLAVVAQSTVVAARAVQLAQGGGWFWPLFNLAVLAMSMSIVVITRKRIALAQARECRIAGSAS